MVDDVCTECAENHYKNSGVCCAIGEYNDGAECTSTPDDHCDKYEDDTANKECWECSDTFYSHKGLCCLDK